MVRLIGFCFILLIASAIMLSAAMVHVIKTDNIYKPKNLSQTIIIDAGHGGFDGGAVVGDVLEKDINLKISNTLCDMLMATGFNVITTRRDDSSTESDPTATISARKKSDLNNRLQIAKDNPDAIYISIHLNKYPLESCKGAQIFYSPNQKEASFLADCIKETITSQLQPDNHRATKQGTKSTYILYYSPIPTVITECGFMSNPTELDNLTKSDYQNKMAFSIYCGILNYFNK